MSSSSFFLKTPRKLCTIVMALGLASAGAWAQTGSPGAHAPMPMPAPAATPQAKAPTPANDASTFLTVQKNSQILASSLIGMSVREGSASGAPEIGKVTDLILNQHRELVGLVVGVGGFLGIGQKDVGIPWNRVQEIDPDQKVAVMLISKKELKAAPEFTTLHERQTAGRKAAGGPVPQGAPAPEPNPAPTPKR